MKLTTFRAGDVERVGIALDDDRIIDLAHASVALGHGAPEFRDLIGLLEAGNGALEQARNVLTAVAADAQMQRSPNVWSVAAVTLLAPIPRPRKFIGIGLNYKDHIAEQNAKTPASPLLFAKFATSIIGPYEDIEYPSFSEQLDYEAELAVVIGRRARSISTAEALDYVAGYTVCNDVTARDVQLRDRQWLRGKTPDRSTPLGPWLVTADEVPDPERLAIRLWLNDELLQESNTDQLLFGIPELISFISECITLEAGDVIATGTPGGVGFTRDPAVFMQLGDIVRVDVEGLGELRNGISSPSA